MSQRWKICLLVLIAALIIVPTSGCDLYSWQHPDTDSGVLWVSENPSMSFAWDEESRGHHGKLIIDGNIFLVGVGFRSNTMGVICEDSEDNDLIRKQLFVGKCKFEKNKITVSVTNDSADIFGGDLPTIVFEKQDRDEEGEEDKGTVLLS